MNHIDNITFENRLSEHLETIKKMIEGKIANVSAPPVNLTEINLLKQKVHELETKLASFKPVDPNVDLNKDFSEIIALVDTLKLDEVKEAPTPDILNKIFKVKAIEQNVKQSDLVASYPTFWKGRVIEPDKDLTLQQWIDTDKDAGTSQFTFNNEKVDNSFDTANPTEKDIVLGTGTGKTTLFARCFAFRKLSNEEISKIPQNERKEKVGLSIVVPFTSLIGSAFSAHNEWLNDRNTAKAKYEETMLKYNASSGDEKEKWLKIANDNFKRVFECPICKKEHTDIDGKPYEIVRDEAGFLNIFTLAEFLDAYRNRPQDINSWVLFDEGHEDIPIYQAIMVGLMGKEAKSYLGDQKKTYHSKTRPFKIARMSATFGHKPISKKLDGVMTDYFTNDFTKIDTKRHPDLFGRKIIVFVDKPDKDEQGNKVVWEKDANDKNSKVFTGISVAGLKKNTKVLILNDAIKDYATDIVKALEPPLYVIASRDYSVGFSFGDVAVIITPHSTRQVVYDDNGVWKYRTVKGEPTIFDMLQGRGRGARSKFMTSVCMFLIDTHYTKYRNDLSKDITAELLLKEFETTKNGAEMNEDLIKRIVEFYSREKEIPNLTDDEGTRYLNLILTKELKNQMTYKLWRVSKDEIDKVNDEKKKFERLAKIQDTKKKSDSAKKIRDKANKLKVREAGEFILENGLLKQFFKPDLLPQIIKKANVERINYYRAGEEDDYICSNKNQATIIGWLLQSQDKENGYTYKLEGDKLSIKFKPFNKYGVNINKITFE